MSYVDAYFDRDSADIIRVFSKEMTAKDITQNIP